MTNTKNIINLDLEGVISLQKARLPHEVATEDKQRKMMMRKKVIHDNYEEE